MSKRMTAKEYRNKRANRSKYKNKKIEIDGHKFDSKAEARYYKQLQLLKRAGEIKDFTLQPKFRLLEGFKKHDKTRRAINYFADFQIIHNNNEIEIIDVKSKATITPTFRIKEKLYHQKYPYKLTLMSWEKERFVEIK